MVIHQFKCRLVRTGSKAGLIFKNPKSKPEIFLDELGPELDCWVWRYMCATRTGTERPVPSFSKNRNRRFFVKVKERGPTLVGRLPDSQSKGLIFPSTKAWWWLTWFFKDIILGSVGVGGQAYPTPTTNLGPTTPYKVTFKVLEPQLQGYCRLGTLKFTIT